MRINKSIIGVASIAIAVVCGTANAGLGESLYARGGDVTVTILGGDAGYTSDLWVTSPISQLIGSNRDVGTTVNLGSFADGQEMTFALFVRDTEDTFFTGPGSRNPDEIPHADVITIDSNTVRVGFEDIFGGGDFDYNDCMFEFTGLQVPAPGPTVLAGVGALCFTRRRRA